MRIAFISFHTSPLATLGGKDTGGMNVFVREAARELARRGHEVDVFTRSNGSNTLRIDPRIASGVRVIHVPAGPEAAVPKDQLFTLVPQFTEWTCEFSKSEELRYDIVHAHYWLSGLVAEQLKSCWGTPFVQTFHTLAELKNQIAQSEREMESELRVEQECHLCTMADRVTAATEVEWDQLVHLYGARSSRIRIVPPGVDISRFHPIEQSYAKSMIGIPKQHRLILFAGRIEPLKGIDTLFHAIAELNRRNVKCHSSNLCVAIIGGDPSITGINSNAEMARLFALRTQLGLDDLVTFEGAKDQDALQYYFAAADCVVMPSHYESFGMVALEAMACGTPVIASDVGGLSKLVRDGETGLLFPPRDAHALADAICKLINDDAQRRRIGHRASCYAEDFSWQRIADKLLAVYAEVLLPATN